jgi:hypothetical protein
MFKDQPTTAKLSDTQLVILSAASKETGYFLATFFLPTFSSIHFMIRSAI